MHARGSVVVRRDLRHEQQRSGHPRTVLRPRPAWPTISGIRVGSTEDDVRRTYSSAQADAAPDGRPMITITNPEGRVVAFLMHEGRVGTIVALSSRDGLRAGLYCGI